MTMIGEAGEKLEEVAAVGTGISSVARAQPHAGDAIADVGEQKTAAATSPTPEIH